jgi:iron complex transport system permease protein
VSAGRKLVIGVVLLSLLLAGVFFWALLAGPEGTRIPAGEVFSEAHRPIVQSRAARALLGIFVGAGLSVAGLILQAVLRNPLADPYVLGVSAGAGLGAAYAILGAPVMLLGAWTIPGCAFLGGVAAILLVYALARVGKTVPVYTLLLSGVIVNSVGSSLLLFLAQTSIARNRDFQGVLWWLFGSLQIFDPVLLGIAGAAILLGILLAVFFARDMNVLSIGEEPAAHLGVRVERTKTLLFVVASLMTGASVAVSGMIGFVGLIVPHAVRLVVGPDHKVLVPLSALAGAVFLVAADIVARSMFGAREIPIGILTSFLGGPFFIYLLRRRRGRAYS